MLRNIIFDYLHNCSFHNLSELYKKNDNLSFFVIYFPAAFCISSIFSSHTPNNTLAQDLAMGATLFIPMLFVYLSILLHPFKLTKMQYLCPMNRTERAKFIKASYLFRIILHNVILDLGLGILALISHFEAVPFIYLLLTNFFISTITCEYTKNTYLQLIVLLPTHIITSASQLVTLSDNEPHRLLCIVSISVLLLIELPLTLNIRKYRLIAMKAAESY